jgi:TRAP-type C4-dicarboxylate transport system permease large subunit
MWHLDMFDAQILAQNVIDGADSFPLLAVPFFMLAGEIMNAGGLSRRIVNFAMALVGHVRGGLGYVTIMAAHHGGALRLGRGRRRRAGRAAAADDEPRRLRQGALGRPDRGSAASSRPSSRRRIGFVIFGVAANVSISKLFLAGIVPGLMLGAALWLTWWWLVRGEDRSRPRAAAPMCWPALPRTDLGAGAAGHHLVGLKFGVFTPTEAAVVAAVYALFVSTVIYRELKLVAAVRRVFVRAAKTTAVVMFLVAAAMVSAWLITVANLPAEVVTAAAAAAGQPRPC